MRGRVARRWVAVGIAGLALAAVARAARAGDEPKAPGAWRDPKVLEARLAEACDAVERVCEAKFPKRPTIRVTTREEIEPILRRELAPQLEAQGRATALDGAVRLWATVVVGKYEPGAHVIHVVPDNAEALARAVEGREPPTEADLRVVLAHEATHALDYLRFPLARLAVERATTDGAQAVDAVSEGHAQYVARRASEGWGIGDAFARFTKTITALPPIDDPAGRALAQAAVAQLAFAYVQGHAFVEAVAAARGTKGVEALLLDPPPGTRPIEHPEEFLEAAKAAVLPDLAEALESFRPLVGDPAWSVVSTRLLQAMLENLSGLVPEEHRKDFLKGYVDGHALVGTVQLESMQVTTILLAFRGEEDARRYVAAEQAGAAAKEPKPDASPGTPIRIVESALVDGAGPDGKLPGYFVRRVVAAGGGRVVVSGTTFAIGRFVGQVVVVNAPYLDRPVLDAAVARLQAYLADPVAARKAPKPEAVPLQRNTRTLVLRVLDAEGKPVPKAKAAFRGRGVREFVEVSEGRASVVVPKTDVSFGVWAARTADGEPLALAPVDGEVPADVLEHEVRLRPGLAIGGRVVDEDEKPVVGVTVEALPSGPYESPDAFEAGAVAHGTAKTGADGAFRLVGLGKDAYLLRLVEAGRLASFDTGTAKGGDTDVVLVLRPGVSVTVTVLDDVGDPVPGAPLRVEAKDPVDRSWRRRTVARADSDAAGKGVLGPLDPKRRYVLRIDLPPSRLDLAPHDEEAWVPATRQLRLQRAYTLKGVVVDEGGAPVRASVTCEVREGETVVTGTSVDGTFTFRGLPRRVLRVRAGAVGDHLPPPFPGSGDEDAASWTEVSPEKPEVRLVLRSDSLVTIRLLGPDGNLVRSAAITVASERRSTSFGVENGLVSFPRPEDGDLVRIRRAVASDGTRLAPVTVRPPFRSPVHELRLEAGVDLSGRVVDEEGKPVAGAVVVARSAAQEERGPGLWNADSEGEATSSADGSFRIGGLGAQEYDLVVEKPPSDFATPPPTRSKGGRSDASVVLRIGGSIVIAVVDGDDLPVAGAHLEIARVSKPAPGRTIYSWVLDLRTDAKGEVRVTGLDPRAPIGWKVTPPEGREDLVPVKLNEGPLAAGRRVRLARGFLVTGVVLDEKGGPVEASVCWETSGGSWEQVATSAADGSFRLPGMPYGAVVLFAQPAKPSGFPRHSPRATATPDSPRVELRLPGKPRDVRIVVPGMKKGRFGTLKSEAADPESAAGRATIGLRFEDDGSAVAKGILRGPYTVWVSAGEEDDTCLFRTGVLLGDGDVTLEATKALAIRVWLKYPAGSHVTQLDAIGPLGFAIAGKDMGDGSWEVRGLPAGRWEVSAKVRAPSAWLRGKVEAEAGTEVEIEPK